MIITAISGGGKRLENEIRINLSSIGFNIYETYHFPENSLDDHDYEGVTKLDKA